MKFSVTFKTPDAIDAVRNDIHREVLGKRPDIHDYDDWPEPTEEEEMEIDQKVAEVSAFAKKWVRYGECITIEFDTEAGTAIVIPCK